MKKPIILFLFFSFLGILCGFSQDSDYVKEVTAMLELDTAKAANSFTKTGKMNGKPVKETWGYNKINDSLLHFTVTITVDPTHELGEEYFVNKGKLIYATESDLIIDPGATSETERVTNTWRGYYYFKDGRSVYVSSLGHGKSESDEEGAWDFDYYIPKWFAARYKDLLKEIKKGK